MPPDTTDLASAPRGGTVVKVGGSLVGDGERLRAVLTLLADGGDGPAAIVPGGGPFADAVRSVQAALGVGALLAHRLALDAMGRMAEVFRELEPRLAIVRSVEAAAAAIAEMRVAVWDPVRLREGHRDVPESWDVTSDSLALWLAGRLGAERCILVKSARCPAGAGPDALARLGLVDRAFPDFAARFAGEIVIRSPQGESVIGRPPESRSFHSSPRPEVRGEAEPRRSPPARDAITGALLRGPPARAPQDEGGIDRRLREPGIGDAAG